MQNLQMAVSLLAVSSQRSTVRKEPFYNVYVFTDENRTCCVATRP